MQEAVALLHADGYTGDFNIVGNRVPCPVCGADHSPAELIVDRFYRFEGDSDPGDEAIVLGLRYPGSDIKATLVSAFGHDADPATSEFLSRLPKS
jgi:hypothetical protein